MTDNRSQFQKKGCVVDHKKRSGLARLTEAAAYLRISRTKLYSLMDAGELRTVKLGKSRRIPWTELKGLIVRKLCKK